MQADKLTIFSPPTAAEPSARPSRARLAIALVTAAVSDAVSMWATFAPPIEWAIDGATALLLFLILGRRWALLPGLITEAIPGMGIFPVWVLVVASIAVYDGIKKPSIKSRLSQ
jgi:hypothetical protein